MSSFSNTLLRLPHRVLISALAMLALGACTRPAAESGDIRQQLQVMTTATMVRDMVEAIGGDRVAVDNLMGPGVDPHLYRPSVMDIRRVSRTEAIFYIGLHFEELMQNVLQQRKAAGQKVFALTDAISRTDLIPADEIEGQYDPHIWFDASLWARCVDLVRDALTELDPNGESYYTERAKAHKNKLEALHSWALKMAGEVPEERRILVTSHDAYNYFGRAYGFQVVGLLGISTSSEAGLADITKLVDFIRENRIPAIFVESSVSPRAIQRVSRDSGVRIGGELFSDALGPRGEKRLGYDVGTYEGTFRYNMTLITEALRSEAQPGEG